MELSQVKQAIENTPKGSNIVLEWLRPCKTRKGVSVQIEKSVRMIGRMGIDYNNMAAVQDKRESGELPADPQPLPWGKWAIFPFLIEHKGQFYVRLYNGTSDKVHPEVHFFMNGVECSKDDIAPFVLASELSEKDGDCFCCKVENMTRINHEAEWIALYANVEQEKVALTVAPVPAKVLATL